ncbi:MAG: flagellar basal body rod protein FlgB [Deltaproteobacteria bacterium]|nr:flagellar basal body rod protein FlgB [Deltaproteobacteria bacterium]
MGDIFGKTVSILEKNLDLRMMRHDVIASNIANQETPGYKAKDLSFQKELNKAGAVVNAGLVRTNKAHLSGAAASSSISGIEIAERPDANSNLDNNNVNPEKEMAMMAENNIMYDAGVQLLSKKFRGLMDAIREGK